MEDPAERQGPPNPLLEALGPATGDSTGAAPLVTSDSDGKTGWLGPDDGATGSKPRRSGTARRLFLAFAILISVFAVASSLTLSYLSEIRDGLLENRRYEEGVRVALELASAVRDQYAHQAHTIILGNASHLPFYEGAQRRVEVLVGQMKTYASSSDELAWVKDIEGATAGLDVIFRKEIVPAVLRHDSALVKDAHGRAQVEVTLIQDRADRLAQRFEAKMAAFRSEAGGLQTAAFRLTLVVLVAAPLLSVLVGAFVLRSVARPVERLRLGAARIAAGDLETRIEVDTPDEFGDLARQFNAMTSALKMHQAQLVSSEKLAGIGRLAAGVAHEINNPLAVILGYSRLLRRRADANQLKDLEVIEVETLRAKEIVDGLLELSRPLATEPEPVDLRAICLEAVDRLRDSGALAGVEVRVSGKGEVRGHPAKLRQIVLNLLRNGAEAAGAGGKVEIAVEPDLAGVVLSVRDSGPGLPAGASTRLFEPFFTTKSGGTGLGLAVSRGIARAHGGDIEASSPPGVGATFTLRLPTSPPGRV